MPEPNTGCWFWMGQKTMAGYGRLYVSSPSYGVYAHRFSYEQFKGPIPNGLVLDHLCRVVHCVNPDHLEAVTDRVNIMRGVSPFVAKSQQITCKYGHNDWRIKKNGTRDCRECSRRMGRERYRRKVGH